MYIAIAVVAKIPVDNTTRWFKRSEQWYDFVEGENESGFMVTGNRETRN